MGNLPIHIYGYNNERAVIVYMVVKDTQSECEQPRHRFQSLRFGPFTLSFQTNQGLQRFQSLSFRPRKRRSSVNDNRSKSYAF